MPVLMMLLVVVLQLVLPLPLPRRLLQRLHDLRDGEVLLHIEHGVPVAPPLLDAAEHGVVLAGLADRAQVVAEAVYDRVGGREFSAQPRDEPVALVHEPLLLLRRGRAVAVLVVAEDIAGRGSGVGLNLVLGVRRDHIPRWHCHGRIYSLRD